MTASKAYRRLVVGVAGRILFFIYFLSLTGTPSREGRDKVPVERERKDVDEERENLRPKAIITFLADYYYLISNILFYSKNREQNNMKLNNSRGKVMLALKASAPRLLEPSVDLMVERVTVDGG